VLNKYSSSPLAIPTDLADEQVFRIGLNLLCNIFSDSLALGFFDETSITAYIVAIDTHLETTISNFFTLFPATQGCASFFLSTPVFFYFYLFR
jgi:hypothetical protein